MALTVTTSTLASVFILESDANSWTKLEDYKLLSQLHAKFWRKDMTEEEQEWRRSHPNLDDGYGTEIGPGCYCSKSAFRAITAKPIILPANAREGGLSKFNLYY